MAGDKILWQTPREISTRFTGGPVTSKLQVLDFVPFVRVRVKVQGWEEHRVYSDKTLGNAAWVQMEGFPVSLL